MCQIFPLLPKNMSLPVADGISVSFGAFPEPCPRLPGFASEILRPAAQVCLTIVLCCRFSYFSTIVSCSKLCSGNSSCETNHSQSSPWPCIAFPHFSLGDHSAPLPLSADAEQVKHQPGLWGLWLHLFVGELANSNHRRVWEMGVCHLLRNYKGSKLCSNIVVKLAVIKMLI